MNKEVIPVYYRLGYQFSYQQFYITLGVGVGGVSEFPDHMRSGESQGYDKPWRNVAAKV